MLGFRQMKTGYTVIAVFLVASVLCGAGYVIYQRGYEAGSQSERKDWKQKWSERDIADKSAQLEQEKKQRNEELRRQKKTQEMFVCRPVRRV